MSFDSPAFLFFFLPPLLVIEALVRPVKAKNVLLCCAGLLFYSFGELWATALLIVSAFVNWLLGLMAARRGKAAVVLAAVLNLGLLVACKYLGFFGQGLTLLGIHLSLPDIAAPAGVSFFTFKGISYVVDAARSPEAATRNFGKALFYISFLPEVMSGPLSRFEDFEGQLSCRSCTTRDRALGLRRFCLGLAKKVLISGGVASAADAAFSAGGALDARLAWMGAIAYCLQLYFDFSGYSDMALGLGRALGFRCPENFEYPYAAVSITDFWRRWHISLSLWFRDYLYIPLGGGRMGELRKALNKFLVFFLCGLWHGANLTFVLWGVWHGLLSALESLGVLNVPRWRRCAAGRLLSRVYAMLAVCLGFVMFRAESALQGFAYLSAMFTGWTSGPEASLILQSAFGGWTAVCFALGLLFSVPVLPALKKAAGNRASATLDAAAYAACTILFILSCAAMASGGFAPFIYFQF